MADETTVPGSREYPELANLLGGYFHQDFELGGDTLEEIIGGYRASSHGYEREALRNDIHRFIAKYGESDSKLAASFDTVFSPDIIAEGWDGLTTREWLLKIDSLLA